MRTASAQPSLSCSKTASTSIPEAEITLRVAFWLLQRAGALARAEVAIDGAHVRIAAHIQGGKEIPERVVFDIERYLRDNDWTQVSANGSWRGTYKNGAQSLCIQSVHGVDVQVRCGDKDVRVECKGGALVPKGRGAAAILASAIGQAITASSGEENEELWVAVPDSPAYERVGLRLMENHAFRNTGIRIALVSKNGPRVVSKKVET